MTKRATFPTPEIARPLSMDEAALALGVSRRFLTESLKGLPFYELRGPKKVFYPEHISALRREMHRCALKSSGETVGPMPAALVPMAGESGALSKLEIVVAQKKRARR